MISSKCCSLHLKTILHAVSIAYKVVLYNIGLPMLIIVVDDLTADMFSFQWQ